MSIQFTTESTGYQNLGQNLFGLNSCPYNNKNNLNEF